MFDEDALRGQQEGPVNELALFSGAGGGILGGHLLGWTTVCAVEKEPYRREVLLRRQRDGVLPLFPIWDDVRTFDGRPWRGLVDVVSGGFPCQDISCAGKGAGINGERSGLWAEYARILREVRPRYAFVENSPMLTSRGLHRVLGDLAEMGFDAEWCVLGATDVGAPHDRYRIWILAYTQESGKVRLPIRQGRPLEAEVDAARCGEGVRWWCIDPADLPDADEAQRARLPSREEAAYTEPRSNGEYETSDLPDDEHGGDGRGEQQQTSEQKARRVSTSLWPVESRVVRMVHGLPLRVQRIEALGDAQVPAVAAAAWTMLSRSLQ